jgi:hypothetical protein
VPYLLAVGGFALLVGSAFAIAGPRLLEVSLWSAIGLLPAGVAVGLLAAWVYDRSRLAQALKGKLSRPPLWSWVIPVHLVHWMGEDRDGGTAYQVRCQVHGQLRALPIRSERLAWFPAGPAWVEMLPDNARHLYRYHFPGHSIETYPALRHLGSLDASPASGRPAGRPERAAPYPADPETERRVAQVLSAGAEWDSRRARRRSRRSRSRGGRAEQRRRMARRRQQASWALTLLAAGVLAAAVMIQLYR